MAVQDRGPPGSNRHWESVLAEGLDESSNLETLPDSCSNLDLFDTLADWNHQLKHAKIDLGGPQP